MSRVGLVTTFRFVPLLPSEGGQEATDTFERCWSTLESFLLFHLAKGVEHVFLYADDDCGTNNAYIERVAETFNESQVSVDVRNESQRQRLQESCRLWGELGSFSATEVPARQVLNAEDALRRAGEMGLDWLLHLDIDELFFTSEPSIQPHFERLNELGVDQMTYANHEAVPSREDVGNYFLEASTFKVNHLLLPLSHEVGERTRFWRRRTGHGQYMLAYDNGKSAVRVLPGRIVPQSVHRWRTLKPGEGRNNLVPPGRAAAAATGGGGGSSSHATAAATTAAAVLPETAAATAAAAAEDERDALGGGRTDEEGGAAGVGRRTSNEGRGGEGEPLAGPSPDEPNQQLVNRVAMVDPRELRFDEVLECDDPCVLHYPSCGLAWLRDKYRLLGRFPSSWFDGKLPIAPCFHLDARNALQEGRGGGAAAIAAFAGGGVCESKRGEGGGDGDGGRALFRREVMLSPEDSSEEIDAQLKHGVLRVIDGPAAVIRQALGAQGHQRSNISPETISTAPEETQRGEQADGKEQRTPGEAGGSPASSSSTATAATSAACLGGDAPAAEDLGAGVDNAWILAACARQFL